MPGEELPQFCIRIEPAAFQNLHRRHKKTGGAEAALDSRFLKERLLNVAQLAVGAKQALQRADALALRPNRKVNAGVEALPVFSTSLPLRLK